jgi:hypothetical protein
MANAKEYELVIVYKDGKTYLRKQEVSHREERIGNIF